MMLAQINVLEKAPLKDVWPFQASLQQCLCITCMTTLPRMQIGPGSCELVATHTEEVAMHAATTSLCLHSFNAVIAVWY